MVYSRTFVKISVIKISVITMAIRVVFDEMDPLSFGILGIRRFILAEWYIRVIDTSAYWTEYIYFSIASEGDVVVTSLHTHNSSYNIPL